MNNTTFYPPSASSTKAVTQKKLVPSSPKYILAHVMEELSSGTTQITIESIPSQAKGMDKGFYIFEKVENKVV